MRFENHVRLSALSLALLAAVGCNPVTTGAKLGVKLVGDVIEDGDVKQRGETLVGQPVAAADEMFGNSIDEFKDVNGDRTWRTYPVKLDVLGGQRYVAEVRRGRIVSLSKAERSGRKLDIPRVLILKEKCKGKSPVQCQQIIELGSPLLSARSQKTNRLIQLYDAGMMTDLGTPHYCIVRYNESNACEDLEFVAVGASTKKDPTTR